MSSARNFFPLSRDQNLSCNNEFNSLPDVGSIYRFINLIFKIQKLSAETAILSLAYIERILDNGLIVLHPENWRRILFGSFIIATKVWEDESVWNVDFLDLFPLMTLIDLNNLENKFLELLQFNVIIQGSEYAKYYFELRALSQLDSFPLEPLNKEGQAKLEERSQKTNQKVSTVQQQQQKENVHPNKYNNNFQYNNSIGAGKNVKSPFRDLTPKRAKSVDFFDPKSPQAIIA